MTDCHQKKTQTATKPKQNICQAPQSIIPNRPGINHEFRGIIDPLLAWAMFIEENIIQIIVTYANQSINKSIRPSKENKESDKLCHLVKTNKRQTKAFIGPWYIWDFGGNWVFHDITTCFSPKYEHKVFHTTISIKSFRFLCSDIQFDDISTRKIVPSMIEQLPFDCFSNLLKR